MGITDELREWAEDNTLQDTVLPTYPPQHVVHGVLETLLRIADRIDTEHQKAIREPNNLANASMLLPVDADGVPIHVGDVMEGEKIGGGFGEPFEVVGYIMSNGELEPMDKHKCPRKRKYLHHHHEPTVEDVLRDMHGELYEATRVRWASECTIGEYDEKVEEIVAEYAAKLRLAGDVE